MKIYLISGDSYRLVNEKITSIVKNNNITTYDLNNSSLEEVIVEAGYLSMFQEEKYIIVKNANFFGSAKLSDKDSELLMSYIEHPNDLTTLIFICNDNIDSRKKITKIMKDKYEVINIPPLKYYEIENRVEEYFKKLKYKINNETIKYIVRNSLNNYDLVMNEVEKIILYYNMPCYINDEDVKNILSKSINTNNFLFVDALIDKNLKKCLQLLEDLKILKVEPTILLSLIARDFRIMLQVKTLQDENKKEYDIAKEIGLQDWQLDKYLKKVFLYKRKELEDILVNLANLDLEIKSGKKDKYVALELFILDICE